MGSNNKKQVLEGNFRNGTAAQFRVFVCIILFGSILFLLSSTKSTKKSAEINSEISTDNASYTQWHEYIPINLEYHNWAAKMGFMVDSDDSMVDSDDIPPECDFMNYIFGAPVSQADPCLIAAVKEKFVVEPTSKDTSEQNAPFNITDELPTNKEKFQWVEKLLIENSTDGPGFYIECGANDGSFISPTIRLESEYNWTGLLIEANPIPFQKLLEKKRNAYAVNAALCIGKNPQPVTFFTYPENTGLSGLKDRKDQKVMVNITVQCIPFYTVLKALDLKVVDYLSLDVEGLELEILKTLPFGKNADEENGEEVIFKVITVEHRHVRGGSKAVRNFLEPRGYNFIKTLHDRLTDDSLFVHESLFEKAKSIKI